MATHSNILVLEVPWTEDLVGYSPWSCKESDMTELMHTKAQFHEAYVIVTQISQCVCAFFLGRVCV